jgi:hypothetical protein
MVRTIKLQLLSTAAISSVSLSKVGLNAMRNSCQQLIELQS